MSKSTLFTIVLATMLVPLLAASDWSPQRGLKRALLLFLLANLFYVALVKYELGHG